MVAMACSSSEDSPTSSCTSSMSDENSEEAVEDSFWRGLARRAKTVLDDPSLDIKREHSKSMERKAVSDALILQNSHSKHLSEGKWKRQESVVLHKGFEAIASSLSLLSDTLGTALEEGLNLVETKATNFIYTEPRSRSLKKSLDSAVSERRMSNVPKLHANPEEKLPRSQVKSEDKLPRSQLKSEDKLSSSEFKPGDKPQRSQVNSEEKLLMSQIKLEEKVLRPQVKADENQGVTKDTQLKASRDVAMAMATKAKLLLRELKGVKTDLAFTKARCSQLEEENKRLRENIDRGESRDEDELVRLQLEALLAEKARLAQENAAYARENQFLHEIVQYHQLKLRSIGFSDENLMLDDEGPLGSSTVDMDFLPFYPEEKDIIALEESVKMATQNVA